MKIKILDIKDFMEYKSTIAAFLIESYKVNFKLSYDESSQISNVKINNLDSYLEQNNATLIGAFDKQNLVGYIWLYKHNYFGETRLHINQISVSKKHRGKGIAKQLIKKTEEFAINNGIKIIDLNVSEINTEAISMYDSIGFSTERRLLKKIL